MLWFFGLQKTVFGRRVSKLRMSFTLKLEVIYSPEKLIPIYKTVSSYSPEDHSYALYRFLDKKRGVFFDTMFALQDVFFGAFLLKRLKNVPIHCIMAACPSACFRVTVRIVMSVFYTEFDTANSSLSLFDTFQLS
jgi:hypothetical protein